MRQTSAEKLKFFRIQIGGLKRQIAELEGQIRTAETAEPLISLRKRRDELDQAIGETSEAYFRGGDDRVVEHRRSLEREADGVRRKIQQLSKPIDELRARCTPLTVELSEATNKALTEAARPDTTTEGLKATVAKHEKRLKELTAQRVTHLDQMAVTASQMDAIQKAEAALADAESKVREEQASQFLAGSSAKGNRKSLDDAIALRHSARDSAEGANAARAHVEADRQAQLVILDTLDRSIEESRALIEPAKSELAFRSECKQFESLCEHMRVELKRLCQVDEDKGRQLIEALASNGLRIFDDEGWLVTPTWLEYPNRDFAFASGG